MHDNEPEGNAKAKRKENRTKKQAKVLRRRLTKHLILRRMTFFATWQSKWNSTENVKCANSGRRRQKRRKSMKVEKIKRRSVS